MSFPPVKTLATVPVSQEIALKFLSTFLSATTTPYLLPGVRLEPSGPAAGSSASPVIYNLQRVEAGLRGEWLAPVLDLQNGDAEGEEGVTARVGKLGEGGADEIDIEGWQDLDEYQREQSVEEGDVGPRGKALAQEGDEGFEERVEVQEVEAPRVKRVKTKYEGEKVRVSKPLDKEERKKAKKERLKEERKSRKAAALKGDAEE